MMMDLMDLSHNQSGETRLLVQNDGVNAVRREVSLFQPATNSEQFVLAQKGIES